MSIYEKIKISTNAPGSVKMSNLAKITGSDCLDAVPCSCLDANDVRVQLENASADNQKFILFLSTTTSFTLFYHYTSLHCLQLAYAHKVHAEMTSELV